MDWEKLESEAADKVREILARPMPKSSDTIGIVGEFEPWDIFPAIYGSYSTDFDKCAIGSAGALTWEPTCFGRCFVWLTFAITVQARVCAFLHQNLMKYFRRLLKGGGRGCLSSGARM
jgi:hypothetical protein